MKAIAMLSRVADAIYWMSRYIERAENVARFVHVNLHLTLDLPLDESRQWEPLVRTTGDSAAFVERWGEPSRENVIRFLTDDLDNPNSIRSCVRRARENARSVREAISSEMWEQVNRFYHLVEDGVGARAAEESPHAFYTEVKNASHLFLGLTVATMSHGEGWHFARLGRMLERADKTARILDVKYFILLPGADWVGTPYDVLLWSSLLRSASAFEMYRKRFQQVVPDRVAEFLLLDRHFPRAVLNCLVYAEESLHAITGSGPKAPFRTPSERRLGRLHADLSYASIEEIIAGGLHEYLDSLQVRLNEVGAAINDDFFALRPVPTALSNGNRQQ